MNCTAAAVRTRSFARGCLLVGVFMAACSSGSSAGDPSSGTGGHLGTGGAAATGSGGSTQTGGGPGSGGVVASGGSTQTGGGSGAGGVASGGTGGLGPGTGGTAGAVTANGGKGGAGPGGSGGAGPGGNGGGPAGGVGGTNSGGIGGAKTTGTGGAGGAAAANTGPFVCNQAMPMTLTREWFEAGFETDASIVDGRWQLKAREHGYITEWANPNSDFWNEPIESPCAAGSTNPDHIVLLVLSWTCCTTAAQWETQINAAIANLKTKYPALKRLDLMTQLRGAGNVACPMAPTAGETVVVPASLDAALAAVAAENPGFVFVAPKWEAPNCAAFSGGGPEYSAAGNTANAKTLAAYFSAIQ